MKILVDTNVILDVLLCRPAFVNDSQRAMEKALINGDRLFFSSSAATDVYYLVHKQTSSKQKAIDAIKQMSNFLIFAPVDGNCILTATLSKLTDYEDAVVDAVASNINADCILTRNIDDFKNASHTVITPTEFLTK